MLAPFKLLPRQVGVSVRGRDPIAVVVDLSARGGDAVAVVVDLCSSLYAGLLLTQLGRTVLIKRTLFNHTEYV